MTEVLLYIVVSLCAITAALLIINYLHQRKGLSQIATDLGQLKQLIEETAIKLQKNQDDRYDELRHQLDEISSASLKKSDIDAEKISNAVNELKQSLEEATTF